MHKLFAALREKHPGCEVVDVRFLVDHNEVNGRDASLLDAAFAKAVKTAERVELADAFN